jgi:type I restriction enzyme S subunit
MSKLITLNNVVQYSKKRIKSEEVTLENYISTDNILQNKCGITFASNLPPNRLAMPSYCETDILIANIRPYLKKIWFADKTGGCSSDVLVFESKKGYFPKFIYYNLFKDDFFEHVMKGSKGTKMPRGDKSQILDFLIPDFDIITQQKIAKVLSDLDAKIELNNKINSQLEAMAKTLYDYWFVQFDFPDVNGKPYKTSDGKMVWNEELKREIPEGWKLLILNNIVDLITGNVSTKTIDSSTPYLGLEHIPRRTIILSSWETADKIDSDKTVFKKHDILFGKIRPYFHKVGIALIDGITSTDTIILRSKINSYKGFALQVVFTDEFVEIATNSSTGSKMPRANWSILKNYRIPFPPEELVENYNKHFEIIIQKIEIAVLENQQLASLRDWLLPMLMNGQVGVGDVEEELGMVAEPNVGYKKG